MIRSTRHPEGSQGLPGRPAQRWLPDVENGEMIWIIHFVNYVSIVLNEINDNSNKNSGSIL